MNERAILKHLTVGVAGHVDHGKTSLVKGLTGIDTDRLKEEEERGMSIVLGFAHLTLPHGVIDFIDVPGHERFIKTMISGASGVDTLMLVIDSRELVMPQTREHVILAGLLGIERGFVVLAKSDLIEAGQRKHIESTLRDFLKSTFLSDCNIIFASAVTGDGMAEIIEELQLQLERSAPTESGPFFYMPVDRSFSITGQGTVVTGTLRYGELKVGDKVEIVPLATSAVVKRLENHNQNVECVIPGKRTAVNLRGIAHSQIRRGDAITTPGFLTPTRQADAHIIIMDDVKPVERGQKLTIHFGSGESSTSVFPICSETLTAIENCYAQLRFAADVCIPTGTRFILRSGSPAQTIGGGQVIDSNPTKRRGRSSSDNSLLELMGVLAKGNAAEKLNARLNYNGIQGYSFEQFQRDCRLSVSDVTKLAYELDCIKCADTLVASEFFMESVETAADRISSFHQSHRLKPGILHEELRLSLPKHMPAAVFAAVCEKLKQLRLAESTNGIFRVPGYHPEETLTEIERRIADEIAQQYLNDGLSPPDFRDVVQSDRRKKAVFQLLIDLGTLCCVNNIGDKQPIVFHKETIEDAKRSLLLLADEAYSVSQIDEILHMTRKHSIPLLEYFDSIGVTNRSGDLRIINKRVNQIKS